MVCRLARSAPTQRSVAPGRVRSGVVRVSEQERHWVAESVALIIQLHWWAVVRPAGLERASGKLRLGVGVSGDRRGTPAPGESEEPAPVREVSGKGTAAEARRIAPEQASSAITGGRRIDGQGRSP